ncbi:helix-turn-helix domain-containing protein [Micromonospora sp. NPDC005171]|uniref:helix-turn-helix domain-containing protein n=1 Tax=Micromonospora sp. NPDC005171 TaxID=3156866 RepID=UPI0033B3FE55
MPRPRKFLESDVVSSASGVFAVHGLAAATLDDLVRATGLGKQSLYNAFGGKRELFLRALSEDREVIGHLRTSARHPLRLRSVMRAGRGRRAEGELAPNEYASLPVDRVARRVGAPAPAHRRCATARRIGNTGGHV